MSEKLKKRKAGFIEIGLIAASFLLGFFIAKYLNFPQFSIGENIDLGDIFSGAVTLFAAYWVSRIIDRRKEIDNNIKSQLVQRLSQLDTEIDACLSELKSNNQMGYSNAAAYFKRMRMTANLVNELCKEVEMGVMTIGDNLNGELGDALELFTNTPVATEEQELQNTPLRVREGFIKMRDDRITSIENSFNKIKNSTLKFQIAILQA
ncbi:hypothetical protein ACS5NO_12640 [Larkinella sp. GY13]|uniref:hypothetical protein n=1 Tax=Larkinella sp. GY13 TaxID=3453720 RepID=UPI003EEF0263